MSRFETSKFIRNPQVMNQEVLKIACDRLGWTYKIVNNELLVTDIKQNVQLYGEFALKVTGDQVIYNSYYLKNGKELIKELQETFFPLNVEYAKNTVISEFQLKGFTLKKLYDFKPTEEERERFCMVGITKLPNEKNKRFEVQFSVLKDGTVITDSNYLPDDVNDLAHKAMDEVERKFGNKRIMTKKPEYDIFMKNRKTSIDNKDINKLKH
ncbi:MAG TPA: hypothetical protein PLG05_09215 [Bacteroidales bacterium]|nr:hypothetical protein [Bacteroidales bacterium]